MSVGTRHLFVQPNGSSKLTPRSSRTPGGEGFGGGHLGRFLVAGTVKMGILFSMKLLLKFKCKYFSVDFSCP